MAYIQCVRYDFQRYNSINKSETTKQTMQKNKNNKSHKNGYKHHVYC